MRLGKAELLRQIVGAASFAGASVSFWGQPRQHPFRVALTRDGESRRFLIYIWNVTHGGGSARAADEYRIQITGVTSIDLIPGVTTLILGYYPAANVFAGWDASQHLGSVASSPSHQVRRAALMEANTQGIAVYPKGNDEVVVCCNPAFLVEYAFTSQAMHGYTTADAQAAMQAITAAPPEEEITVPHRLCCMNG